MSDLFAYFSRAQQSIVEQVQQVNVDEVKSNIWSFVKNVSAIAMGEAAAEDIGIVYVKPQLIAMEFPSRDTRLNGVPADNMGKWLMEKHKGKFMVYNLSDRNYDYAIFQDQVIEFKFPGYPAPPLDKVFSICKAIDGWVKADDENVVAVHCQTGKGRTITVLACYLAWVKEFKSAIEAAEYIAKLKKQPLDKLLIPTQHRYISYFDNLLTSKLPSRKHLRLQKIIVDFSICVFVLLKIFAD
jgi:tensin